MFKFRLDTVLDYRAFLEDRKKMELADKQRIYLENKKKGDLLRTRRIQYHEALRAETGKDDVVVEKLSTYQNYIIIIENQILVQDERTREALDQMEKVRQEMVEARKQKEVMVRAKENAYKKYLYEEGLKDQKELDEVSAVKFVRSMRGMDSTAQAIRV